MELRDKLRHFRKERGISQMEAADQLEVSRQTIHRWEAGTSVPTTENLLRLSELYGVPLDVWMNPGWTPPGLGQPEEPGPALPEPPAREAPGKLLRRRGLRIVLLAVVLAVGVTIGIWFSHRDDGKVISMSEMEGEVIDFSTLEDPIPWRPLPPDD